MLIWHRHDSEVSRGAYTNIDPVLMQSAPNARSEAESCLAIVRERYWKWIHHYGSMSNWPVKFEEELYAAKDADRYDEWVGALHDMVDAGLDILKQLKGLAALEFPRREWEVKDVWRQSFDLMAEMHAATSFFQARVTMMLDLGCPRCT
jgi:hypothetical protein